ncbi:MAG TPA: hypothetical protein VG815_12705 [Chloroflexota bacterium]|nr:hypothetical protein [Chloroflexota bacterium]
MNRAFTAAASVVAIVFFVFGSNAVASDAAPSRMSMSPALSNFAGSGHALPVTDFAGRRRSSSTAADIRHTARFAPPWDRTQQLRDALSSRSVRNLVPAARFTSSPSLGGAARNSLPNAGGWQALEATRPVLAPDPLTKLDALSCPATGNCVAVGTYEDAAGNQIGILLTQSGGAWTAVKAPLPAGASKQVTVDLYDVACPTAGHCMAVGDYSDIAPNSQGAGGDFQGLLEVLSGGKWSAIKAKVPSDSDFHPLASLLSVSCPTMASCTAVGLYAVSGQPADWILYDTSSGWKSIDAPTSNASGNGGANNPGLSGVDCFSPGSCVAVGSFQNNIGAGGLFDQEKAGKWKAIDFPNSGNAYLSYAACTSATSCEAVGGVASSNGNVLSGFALSDSNGKLTGTQTPLPAGVTTKQADEADLYSIACVSAGSCVAIGAYFNNNAPSSGGSGPPPHALLLSLSGAKWTAPVIPSATGAAASQLNGVACGVASCIAVGQYSLLAGVSSLLITGAGGSWKAHIVGGTSGTAAANLQAADCPKIGTCSVTGQFADPAGNSQGVFVNSKPSGWRASQTPLPHGAGYAQSIEMDNIDCLSAGSCVALGTNQFRSVVVETLAAGGWTPSIAPNPSDLNSLGQIGPRLLSCVGPKSCVASADYVDIHGGDTSAILSETNGSWSAMTAPLPAGAATPKSAVLSSLSCPVAGHCVAVGYYVDNRGGYHGLIETDSAGSWTAQASPNPPNTKIGFLASLTGVSCEKSTQCTAVGVLGKRNGPDYPLIVTLTGTSWTAVKGPIPSNGTGNFQTLAELTNISCSPTTCAAIGLYIDKNQTPHGLIVAKSGGGLVATDAATPSKSDVPTLDDVSCAASSCVVVGYYQDSNGNSRALIMAGSGSSWVNANPTTGTPPSDSELVTVTCIAPTACQAAGALSSPNANSELPLLASLSGGKWALSLPTLPAGAAPASRSQISYLSAESCPPAGPCVAVGFYVDTNTVGQGLIEQQK